MQDNNEIYQFMKANSLTDKDEKTFLNEYSNPQKAKEIYSFFQANKLTDKDETAFFDTYLKKKGSTTSRSLDAQSQLPLQKTKSLIPSPEPFLGNELQQGSIKEAALADKKKNESYLGAMWNNAVASVARLAGGATRFAYLTNTNPYAMMERSLLANASKITNKNLLAAKEKEIADAAKGFVEKARTSVSSKEYEKSISEGFDLTNGIGVSDLKALGQMIPQFAADMGLGAVTGGGSFAIQGYDDALSMIDEIPEASNISEGTRIAFGLGGALVVGALDKLGLDNITKDPFVKRYVTAKIIKEATDEFVKKGVEIGAKQFEQAVIDKASKLTAKELTKLVASKTVKSAAIEGGTEAAQEAGMDLLKLAANKLEGKDIFNEEEMKDTAAKRYLNSFAAGGVLGGIGGSVIARVQNTQNAIKSKLEKAQTIEDIDAIVGEINESVSEGVMTQEEAEDILPIVENFVEVSKKLPESLNGKNKVVAVDLINERDKINNQLKEVEAKKLEIDPAFHGSLDADAKKIEERFNEINKELEELAKPENNIVNEEVEVLQPTEVEIPTTETVSEVKPTEVKVTEEVKPTEVKGTLDVSKVLPYVVEGREKFEPVIEKIKNNEIVNENDLYEAASILEDLKSKAKNESLNNLINPIIDKILTYENQSKTEVSTITQKGAVTRFGVDVRKKPVSKSIGQFEGNKATIKYPDGKKISGYVKSEGGEYVLYNLDGNKVASIGEKQITDRDIILPSNELVPNPITIDNNGNIKSITLQLQKVDKDAGLVPDRLITIDFKNPDQALDYAIQLRAEQVGDFSDAEFEEIIIKVEREIPIKSGKIAKQESKPSEVKNAEEESKVTKEGGTKQPEPVKKRKGEKEAYKDLTRNEKRQIINSKFDELIKELKIEKICPT